MTEKERWILKQTLRNEDELEMEKKFTTPLESATRKKIDQILNNLEWNTDEFSTNCNVFTESKNRRAKQVIEENKRLQKTTRLRSI